MAKLERVKEEVIGKAKARWRMYREGVLRAEYFTEGEIRVYIDRRISTLGMRYLRRERARELRGLTEEEKKEWLEQHQESLTEEDAYEALQDVSP